MANFDDLYHYMLHATRFAYIHPFKGGGGGGGGGGGAPCTATKIIAGSSYRVISLQIFSTCTPTAS